MERFPGWTWFSLLNKHNLTLQMLVMLPIGGTALSKEFIQFSKVLRFPTRETHKAQAVPYAGYHFLVEFSGLAPNDLCQTQAFLIIS